MNPMRRYAAALLVLTLALSGCGDSVVDDGMVAAFAQWECDRQRFAFETLAAIDDLREEALSEAGYTEADYQAFVERLDTDGELRRAVLAEYEALCFGPHDT